MADTLMSSAHKERFRLPDYLGLLHDAQDQFAQACESVVSRYLEEPEIRSGLGKLAKLSRESNSMLAPFIERHGEHQEREGDRLRKHLFSATRADEFGLLRDLHDLYLMFSEVHIALVILYQGSQALREHDLLQACKQMQEKNAIQKKLLLTQIKHRAPHALVIPF